MKYTLGLFMALFFTTSVTANTIHIPVTKVWESKVEAAMPQIYIFNDTGKLIHFSRKYTPSLVKAFSNKVPVDNAESLASNFLSLIEKKIDFSQYDFTFFYMHADRSMGKCPPCDKQEKVINTLKSKYKKFRINYTTIMMDDA